MLALEPVPALTSVLFALKMAKLSDDEVNAQLASIDGRAKQTKSADTQGWASIYRDALALIPRAVAAQQRAEQERQQAAGQQAARQRLASLAGVVPQKLQRAFNDWGARLQEQTQELRAKAERAAERMELKSTDDDEHGETVFQLEDAQLAGFWDWLIKAEAAWRANNNQLVAVRANELLGDLKNELPPGLSFEVRPADLPPLGTSPPRLKGFRIATPSRFEALGSTYKAIMGVIMAVSSVGFLGTRLAGNQVAALLPWAFGAAFVLAVIYAVSTVPRQYRQAMARKKDDAADRVRAELAAAVKERLDQGSASQSSQIKKHLLQAEDQRWSRLVHEATGGSNPGLGALAPMAPMGLAPQDLARLQGEWREAIAARLAQLGG